jgi:carbonic anhydrase/acetyltransferase-like protein (isoleucine patch superfamily)
MGAIINDGSHIGYGAVIASGALVAPHTKIPERKLVVGVPGKIARDVDPGMESFIWVGTRLYQTLPERYSNTLEKLNIEDCRA